MNLRVTILKDHSKANCNLIVNWVGNDQKKFDELFHLFMHGEELVVQRAAWPVSYCVEAHPVLIKKHLKVLVQNLYREGLNGAVKRNTVRLLQYIDIPEKYHGPVMDNCFNFIEDPNEKPAVKAFSLTILQRLSERYPEIKNELKMIIEERFEQETAAFRSRAKKLLRNL